MFWNVSSTRILNQIPGYGNMDLCLAAALGGEAGIGCLGLSDAHPKSPARSHGELPSAGLAGGPGGAKPTEPAQNSPETPQSGENPSGNAGTPNNSGDEQESGEEIRSEAQPSGEGRVPEDMATLVLDKSALGVGPGASAAAELTSHPYAAIPGSDAEMMLRVAAGDEASFNHLVARYHRPMIHFLYRMVHNQAVAEEMAQEVFLRVYRSRESYRAEAKFTTWLYRIATNLAVNHARDTKYERSAQTIYLDAPDPETGTMPDVADDDPTVEQDLLRKERMASIRKHVMALPERQRMAVLMHKYQGIDYRQIGEVLKLSESATKSLLFRAYQTLREKLKDYV